MRAVAAAILLSAGLAQAAVDATDVCRRFPIFAAPDGAPIVGPEDVVFDAANDRFLVSAFDRRQSAPDKQGRLSGGLFVLPRAALVGETATLTPLAGGAPALRPHGVDIGYSSATAPAAGVWAISRAMGGPATDRTRLAFFPTGAAPSIAPADVGLCRANDIVGLSEGGANDAYATLDRGACGGFTRFAEEIFGLKRGAVAVVRDGRLHALALDGLDIPNGIAIAPAGPDAGLRRWIAIAQTRGRRVSWAVEDDPGGALTITAETPLAGGPDNLNRLNNDDDRLLAVAFDSLFSVFLHRLAPGSFDPPSSTVHLLSPPPAFGAPAPPATVAMGVPGDLYAGATVAAYDGDRTLLVGSATETGLLVCDWSPPPRS